MGASSDQRRAFVVVIDALGAGAEPDAADYGDEGANTLLHLAKAAGGLRVPALAALGLGNILPLPGVRPSAKPAVHGTLSHQGPGKDSTSGHWELFGVVMERPLPTFPDGLPQELVDLLEQATGLSFCCGLAIDGIAAIEQFGEHHMRTGEVILYTSVRLRRPARGARRRAAHAGAAPRMRRGSRSARPASSRSGA